MISTRRCIYSTYSIYIRVVVIFEWYAVTLSQLAVFHEKRRERTMLTLDDMCVGEGELAQMIISALPLRAIARLALTSSLWARLITTALTSSQAFERYESLLTKIEKLVPSEVDAQPNLLLALAEEAHQLCGKLDATALENLRAGRRFAFPCRDPMINHDRPCFLEALPGRSYYEWRTFDSGAEVDIAYFHSFVIPAAFQDEVHACFRAVATRQEAPEFAMLIERVCGMINARARHERRHYDTRNFNVDTPTLRVPKLGASSSIAASFVVYPSNRLYPGHKEVTLPRCRSEWAVRQVVDAAVCTGFDVDLLRDLLHTSNGFGHVSLGVILQALVDGGRVFGVLSEAAVAGMLFELATHEDDEMVSLAQAMREGGRQRYPPSLIAILAEDYTEYLYDQFVDQRYNGEWRMTLIEDVVDPFERFCDGLHFPSDFSTAEQQPILDAISRCSSELKQGLRVIALRWIDEYVGAAGTAPSSAEAVERVRAICTVLLH